MSYSFTRNSQGDLESLVAWSYSFFVRGLREAVEAGYNVDEKSAFNDQFEYKYAVGLKKVGQEDSQEKEIRKALLAYAQSLDPSIDGRSYRTISSLLEKINET